MAGVVAVEAIQHITCYEENLRRGLCNLQPKLKWPNDININGKKAGGILTEGISKGKAVIVGIGINVNTPPWGGEGFSDELKDKATSIMMETGKRVDRNLLIAELLNSFEYWYEKFIEERDCYEKMERAFRYLWAKDKC